MEFFFKYLGIELLNKFSKVLKPINILFKLKLFSHIYIIELYCLNKYLIPL